MPEIWEVDESIWEAHNQEIVIGESIEREREEEAMEASWQEN